MAVGEEEFTENEYDVALREIADWLQEYFPDMVTMQRKLPMRADQKGAKLGESYPNGKVDFYLRIQKEAVNAEYYNIVYCGDKMMKMSEFNTLTINDS